MSGPTLTLPLEPEVKSSQSLPISPGGCGSMALSTRSTYRAVEHGKVKLDSALDPVSEIIAQELTREFPDVSDRITSDGADLVVTWPSANPSVAENLVLRCTQPGYPSLYWFGGYMVDFPLSEGQHLAREIVEFLIDFFEERIACGITPSGGGGPVWLESPSAKETSDRGSSPRAKWWEEEGVTLRTWRGTYDFGGSSVRLAPDPTAIHGER